MSDIPDTIRWSADSRAVDIIDQRLLPEVEQRLLLHSAEEVAEAIRVLAVRGAPAIGIAAAMGFALELAKHTALPPAEFEQKLNQTFSLIAASRPTGVNLFWALERMRKAAARQRGRPIPEIACKLFGEASAILAEDKAMCRAIGEHAEPLLRGSTSILTHCNAGALATGGMGTALAGVYMLQERGGSPHVFASETRPAWQGSRLTAWELTRSGVDVTVITDSTVASLMRARLIDLAIVGADRIAANGDTANKIGTYSHAVLARHHGIPFYVAAPSSSIDTNLLNGDAITIEERAPDEVRRTFDRLTAPAEVKVRAPAFDVTPAELITAIITDRGVLRPPFTESIAASLHQRAEAAQ